jgi:hypothetical protein
MKLLKITIIILTAVMVMALTGCGNDKSNDVTPVSASADEVKTTTTAEVTAAIPQIDCFEGVEITLSGISPNGKLTINKENASQDIRKFVSFSADLSSGIHNGDTIVVTAYYDNGGVRYQQTKEIEADLPFYITDLSGYDTSEMITAMDETANSTLEKLNLDETVTAFDIIGNYDEFAGSIWVVNTATWIPCADYFGTVVTDKNAYVRAYNLKVNATKQSDMIEYDGYEKGVTEDFDVFIYVICKGIVDDGGVISMPNKPVDSKPGSNNIKPFSTIEDIETLCDNYFISYETIALT